MKDKEKNMYIRDISRKESEYIKKKKKVNVIILLSNYEI